MIRRLNYTGRRKIPRSRVTIRLFPSAENLYGFTAEYDLSGSVFPPDARVFIEAYNIASYMRFAFGTVSEREDPRDTRLLGVTPRPLPKFRLKVVDQRRRYGLLLGVADKLVPLRPQEDLEHKQSLLPVDFCDLGDRVWRLDLSDWPVLELNSRIETIAEQARSGESFLGLVYPEVLRRVLYEIVITQDQTDPEFDDSEWTTLWLRYVCSLPGVSAPPSSLSPEAKNQRGDWIDQVVQAFCRANQIRRRFEMAIVSGSN